MAKTDKKSEEAQKFELAKLDPGNIVELEGWEQKQNEILTANPFQPITDNATYLIAKQRRTALVTARTTIEKQDSLIGKVVTAFRKKTITASKDLIEITKEAEEKQQAEVKRYEAILEEQRQEKQREEEARVGKIMDKIKSVETALTNIVDGITYSFIEPETQRFEAMKEEAQEFDYEEFEGHFNEMINRCGAALSKAVQDAKTAEEERLVELKRSQEAKVNEIYRQGSELLDNATAEDSETLHDKLIEITTVDFDFGEQKEAFKSTKDGLFDKYERVVERLAKEKEAKIKAEIETFEEVSLETLDEADVDSFPQIEASLQALIRKKSSPGVWGELFNKTKARIEKEIARKKELVEKEKALIEAQQKAEEQKAVKLLEERGDQLEKLGMVWENEDDFPGHRGFGIFINDEVTVELSEDEWNERVGQIEAAKEQQKQDEKRQTRIAGDKKLMVKRLSELNKQTNVDCPGLKNQEMKTVWTGINSKMDEFFTGLIQEINNL